MWEKKFQILRQKKGWMEFKIISKKQQAKFATKKMTQNEFKPFLAEFCFGFAKKTKFFPYLKKKRYFWF